MKKDTVHDVVVVGAGPAGLALALAIHRGSGRGAVDVRVFDRSDGEIPDDPRGWAIAEGPRRVLESLGVWQVVEPASGRVREMVISDTPLSDAVRPSLLSLGEPEAARGEGDAVAWIVPAGALHRALMEACEKAGIGMDRGTLVTSFTNEGADARLETAAGGQIRARLVVAADGARSRLRRMAGIRTVEWEYGQTGIVTTVSHEFPHEGRAYQHFLPGGPLAFLPLPGNTSSIVWTLGKDKAERLLRTDDAGFDMELAMSAGPELGEITSLGPRGGFPLGLMVARAFAVQRLALVGDAAHKVHPLAGQGLNLGLKDVAALAEVVVDSLRLGIDPGAATQLARYERWRRFDVVQMAVATDALNRLFAPDIAPLRAIRDIGMGLVDRSALLKRWVLREASGLAGSAPKLIQGLPL